jgi:hypothetical protein
MVYIKVKVKLSPCFDWIPRHEGVLRSESIAPRILDLGTRCEWSASRAGCIIPRERASDTHWIGGWVGPRAGLDSFDVEDKSFPYPCRESDSGRLTLRQKYVKWNESPPNLSGNPNWEKRDVESAHCDRFSKQTRQTHASLKRSLRKQDMILYLVCVSRTPFQADPHFF